MLSKFVIASLLLLGAGEETAPVIPNEPALTAPSNSDTTLTPIPEAPSTSVPVTNPASAPDAAPAPAPASVPATAPAAPTPAPTPAPVSSGNEKAIIARVPLDWYKSTTNLFNYCVDVKFAHPICPPINKMDFSEIDFNSDFFAAPIGALSPQTLFQATVLYEVGRAPEYWLVGLGLDKKKPEGIDARLWAEAQLLWARLLYDRRQYAKSLELYDKLVDEFKGRALFHQQRAWAQYHNRKFDRALGSIVSSESPLIFSTAFFDKYFLRALIEKENCLYQQSLKTIMNGREFFTKTAPDPKKHPWVILCERRNLGAVCSRLEGWYRARYAEKSKSALSDLDLLEIEIRDRLTEGQKQKSESMIVWPYVGENWKDELGYYSVPIKSACAS